MCALASFALGSSCNPEVGPAVVADSHERDHETHAAATEVVLPSQPQGNIYVTANKNIYRSKDGGASWTRVSWEKLPELVPKCNFVPPKGLAVFGDSDVKASRAYLSVEQLGSGGGPIPPSPVLDAYPAYAAFLFGGILPYYGPQGVVLYHTGYQGALVDDMSQCHAINVYEEIGKPADKAAIALVEESDKYPAALWVSWIWHGYAVDMASTFLSIVPLEHATGDFLAHTPPMRLNNPGEDDVGWPHTAKTDWGPCSVPAGGVDQAGRGNMFADVDGSVYLAFSNNDGLNPKGCVAETRRIYVRRLATFSGKLPFLTCVDQIEQTDCGTTAPIIEENDPTVVVDPRTGLIVVSYLTRPDDASGKLRATLAWSQDGTTWTRRVVGSSDVDADQTQPSLAVTTSLDPLDRIAQGTYFLTWYEPTSQIVPLVKRAGQLFATNLQPRSGVLTLSEGFFPRDFSAPFCWDCPRGVYEYQGSAHAPGANRWVASWTAPLDATDPDLADDNYRIWTNTVP